MTWLSGLYNPQSFLTAICQVTAQKNGQELDKLITWTDPTKKMGVEEIEGHYLKLGDKVFKRSFWRRGVLQDSYSAEDVAHGQWLTDADLAVYVAEYQRRGFQGGLQWYRCATSLAQFEVMSRFGGQSIHVPSAFIAGEADWGIYQFPGALDKMKAQACKDMRFIRLLPQAGHWVQQEQPEAVNQALLGFLSSL